MWYYRYVWLRCVMYHPQLLYFVYYTIKIVDYKQFGRIFPFL